MYPFYMRLLLVLQLFLQFYLSYYNINKNYYLIPRLMFNNKYTNRTHRDSVFGNFFEKFF